MDVRRELQGNSCRAVFGHVGWQSLDQDLAEGKAFSLWLNLNWFVSFHRVKNTHRLES